MELDDDGLCPPCDGCLDEPVAVDPDGRPFSKCPTCLIRASEPHEHHAPDPDEAMQALRDRRAS